MGRDQNSTLVSLLLALAGTMTVLYLYWTGANPDPDTIVYYEMVRMGRQFGPFGFWHVAGGWFPPGYSWLLQLTIPVLGENILVNATFVNAASVFVVVYTLTKLLQSEAQAADRFAVSVMALALFFALMAVLFQSGLSWRAMSEMPALATTALGLYLLVQVRQGTGQRFALGLGTLFLWFSWPIRHASVFVLPLWVGFIVVYWLTNKENLRRAVRGSAALLIIAVSFVFWMLLVNYRTHGYWLRKDQGSLAQCSFADTIYDWFAPLVQHLLPPTQAGLPTYGLGQLVLSRGVVFALAILSLALGLGMAVRWFWGARGWCGWIDRIARVPHLEWLCWSLAYTGTFLIALVWFVDGMGVWGTQRYVGSSYPGFMLFAAALALRIRKQFLRRALAMLSLIASGVLIWMTLAWHFWPQQIAWPRHINANSWTQRFMDHPATRAFGDLADKADTLVMLGESREAEMVFRLRAKDPQVYLWDPRRGAPPLARPYLLHFSDFGLSIADELVAASVGPYGKVVESCWAPTGRAFLIQPTGIVPPPQSTLTDAANPLSTHRYSAFQPH